MTNDNQKPAPGSVKDLLAVGASTILSLFPATAPVGAMGSYGLFVWQREQLNKFIDECKQRFDRLDQDKLDRTALESDEFKSLLLQAVEIGAETASDLKRKALASAISNSVVLPTSQFTGKQALLRVLSQLDDQEMLALGVFSDEEPRLVEYEATMQEHKLSRRGFVTEADVARKLGWNEEEASVVCEGLSQLGLIYSTTFGAVLTKTRDTWRITVLAKKLIKWSGE
jgi:hypothetical protein